MVKRRTMKALIMITFSICMLVIYCSMTIGKSDIYQYVLHVYRPSYSSLYSLYQKCSETVKHISPYAEEFCVFAKAPTVSVSTNTGTVTATAYAVDERCFALSNERTLVYGRLLFDFDIEKGENVALIDETTAFALFSGGDGLGRIINLDNKPYRIVGIVRNHNASKDETDHAIYIPITSIEQCSHLFRTFECYVLPQEGEVCNVVVQKLIERWKAEEVI